MRLNLQCGNNLLDDYINVESSSMRITKDIGNKKLSICSYGNLDPIAKDSEVNEIIFGEPINVIEPNQIVGVFQHWCNKLCKDGILKTIVCDINIGARMVRDNPDNHSLYNSVFYSRFKSIMTSTVFEDLVKTLKLTTISREKNKNYIVYTLRKDV